MVRLKSGWKLAHLSSELDVQILTQNVQALKDAVKVVPAALVPEEVARRGETVNFAAESKKEYWAFRVVPEKEVHRHKVVHKVPTYSISDIQVRPMPSYRNSPPTT